MCEVANEKANAFEEKMDKYRMEIVEDKVESGFVISLPELPGCITCGETLETAVANILDAKKAWLEAAIEEGIEISEPNSLEKCSGQFKAIGGLANETSHHQG